MEWVGSCEGHLCVPYCFLFRYTYEMAPVYCIMEKECISQMLSLAGFPGGEGILCPGGSISNLLALTAARHRYVTCVRMYASWSAAVCHVCATVLRDIVGPHCYVVITGRQILMSMYIAESINAKRGRNVLQSIAID